MAEAAPSLERIRVLKKDVVINNRICKVGDTLDVDAAAAGRLTAEGAASYATEVRALIGNRAIGNQVAARGEVVRTSERIARAAVASGFAEFYSAGMPELPPEPPRADARPADPYAAYGDMPRIKVKFLAPQLVELLHHAAGDVASIPEIRAVELFHAGRIELVGVMKWTERGARFLAALVNHFEDRSY